MGGSEGQHTTKLGGLDSDKRVLSSLGQSRPRPWALPAPGRCAGRSEERALPTLRMYKPPGQRRAVRAIARDAWTPGLHSLGGVPLLGVPSHNSEIIEGGPGHLLAWVLSCFAEAVLEPELPSPHPGAGAAREEEAGGAEGRGRGRAGPRRPLGASSVSHYLGLGLSAPGIITFPQGP